MRIKVTSKLLYLLLFFCVMTINTFAINDIVARIPGSYTQYPGYIRNPVVVTEPHGAYTEQSVYLEYTDNGAIGGYSNIEIIHRFELPEGAVVNDLWLWMGNKVMRALILDQTKARAIYDSIVSMKRDPAFLSKIGNQYELHVYPLQSGFTRKIKINFIVPTKWVGEAALSEMPLKFLKPGLKATTNLEVLFRYRSNVWGTPSIYELPNTRFAAFKDTLGFHFKRATFSGVPNMTSLNLAFSTSFDSSVYFNNNVINHDRNYFQFGIIPWEKFNIAAESGQKKNLIEIDLSGNFNKTLTTLAPKLKSIIKSAVRVGDKFKLKIAGNDQFISLSPNWTYMTANTVDSLIDNFIQTAVAKQIETMVKPKLIFADDSAQLIWNYPGMTNYVNKTGYYNILDCIDSIPKANIVAGYKHGFEAPLLASQAAAVEVALDSLFAHGGTFLSYYDRNRISNDRLVRNYIPSIGINYNTTSALTLKRNTEGNIGLLFPESIIHNGGYFLDFNDPDVKTEFVDQNGHPTVISKKIGKGLLVVTGLWPFNDDDAMKKILANPLLGLNKIRTHLMLDTVLGDIVREHNLDAADRVLLFTNSDTITTTTGTLDRATAYANKFNGIKPVFLSVNLCDGTTMVPPMVTVTGTPFNTAGYYLKSIAGKLSGTHFEMATTDITTINDGVQVSLHPIVDYVKVIPTYTSLADTVYEISEVNALRSDSDRPLFFLGSTNSTSPLTFDVDVRFRNITSTYHTTYAATVNGDTTLGINIIPSIMGYEKLKQFQKTNPLDTAGIVSRAMRWNLLCDYTALLALEPNDTIHFLDHPFDEGGMVDINQGDNSKADTLYLVVYPNPIKVDAKITIGLNALSNVKLAIYDMLGKEVITLANEEKRAGKYDYQWNCKDASGSKVSSGVYVVSLRGSEQASGKQINKVTKIVVIK